MARYRSSTKHAYLQTRLNLKFTKHARYHHTCRVTQSRTSAHERAQTLTRMGQSRCSALQGGVDMGHPGVRTKSQIMIAKMEATKEVERRLSVAGPIDSRQIQPQLMELHEDSRLLTFEEAHDLVGALYALNPDGVRLSYCSPEGRLRMCVVERLRWLFDPAQRMTDERQRAETEARVVLHLHLPERQRAERLARFEQRTAAKRAAASACAELAARRLEWPVQTKSNEHAKTVTQLEGWLRLSEPELCNALNGLAFVEAHDLMGDLYGLNPDDVWLSPYSLEGRLRVNLMAHLRSLFDPTLDAAKEKRLWAEGPAWLQASPQERRLWAEGLAWQQASPFEKRQRAEGLASPQQEVQQPPLVRSPLVQSGEGQPLAKLRLAKLRLADNEAQLRLAEDSEAAMVSQLEAVQGQLQQKLSEQALSASLLCASRIRCEAAAAEEAVAEEAAAEAAAELAAAEEVQLTALAERLAAAQQAHVDSEAARAREREAAAAELAAARAAATEWRLRAEEAARQVEAMEAVMMVAGVMAAAESVAVAVKEARVEVATEAAARVAEGGLDWQLASPQQEVQQPPQQQFLPSFVARLIMVGLLLFILFAPNPNLPAIICLTTTAVAVAVAAP